MLVIMFTYLLFIDKHFAQCRLMSASISLGRKSSDFASA